jgi:hypothetical protein
MTPRVPVPHPPEASRRPKPGEIPEPKNFRFSLHYWRQIAQFGLAHCANGWFISLLERLQGLSASSLDDVMHATNVRDALRIHDIDWTAKGIKTKLADIDWLPQQYAGNQDEYPLLQIHISKAMGRIIGFFDEHKIFHVVLLDPNHNLQPSKFSGYKIRATGIGACEISQLKLTFERAIGKATTLSADERLQILGSIKRPVQDGCFVLTCALTVKQAEDFNIALSASGATDVGEFVVNCLEDAITRN